MDYPLLTAIRQRNEAIQSHGFGHDLPFFRRLNDELLKFIGDTSSPIKSMAIVMRVFPSMASALAPTKIKREEGGTRFPRNCKKDCISDVSNVARPLILRSRSLNFQSLDPNLRGMLVCAEPVERC